MSANDLELALRLQDDFDREYRNAQSPENRNILNESPPTPSRKRPYSEFDLDGTQQIVHPLWETLDPTPDIFGMFRGFNSKFFQGKLHCVELEWSKRMYSCAGICYLKKNGYGMAITIRLSEPLLKLRSRKNLVETLLHEMIHAYLFILNIREENGGHGPNFKRIMTNINKAAGTNITVYHTFHDEVNFYKTHIWRCNGICQHRGPFFGYVRRTANRAPGPNDNWFAHHREQCGGTFLKVSEPDPPPKKSRGKATATSVSTNSKIDNPRWGMVKKTTPTGIASRASTIVVRKPPTTKNSDKIIPPTNHVTADRSSGRNLANVVGFRDLNGGTGTKAPSATPVFPSSNGRTLGSSGTSTHPSSGSSSNLRESVRDIWSKKYSTTTSAGETKKLNPTTDTDTKCLHTPSQSNWVQIDDDIEVENVILETVTILDDSLPVVNSLDDSSTAQNNSQLVRQSSDESSIKREIVASFGDDLTDSDIELIDCDYDDTAATSAGGLCNKKITDNLFSWNKSTEDLNKIHMTDEENYGNPDKELVSCPVCNVKCERDSMSDHLDGCFGTVRKVDHRRPARPPVRSTPIRGAPVRAPPANVRTSTVTRPTSEEEEYNRRILSEMEAEARESRAVTSSNRIGEMATCPVCLNSVKVSEINEHLDACLS